MGPHKLVDKNQLQHSSIIIMRSIYNVMFPHMILGVCLTLKASHNDHKSALQEKAPIPGFSQHLALPVFSHLQQKQHSCLRYQDK